jgi:superfamily II DNA or RNA helicase
MPLVLSGCFCTSLPAAVSKTLIFCTILKSVHQKGKKAIMVVRGVQLIEQASQRLDREGVPHGVMQAGHWRNFPHEPIQVCSIDTLYRRKIVPQADLVVIDEAHLASSDGFKWLVDQYPEAFFLPVTATPWVKKGLRHIADVIVKPISMQGLIDEGYLVPARYLIPTKLDLSNVKIDRKTHDYQTNELSAYMKAPNLFGDIVRGYVKHGENRPALAFAVDISHSLMIVQAFNEHNIPAAHIDANTKMEDRESIIKALENREIQVISSVGVLTTGVDIPCVSCIIMARPTKSYNLYIQALGRGTRPHKDKDDFIVLDHANNVIEHGMICSEKDVDLDGKISEPRESNPIICQVCYTAFEKDEYADEPYLCPHCGADNTPAAPQREAVIDQNYDLIEFNKDEIELELIHLFKIVTRRGYNPWWAFHQIKRKFGDEAAERSKKSIKKFIARQFDEEDHPSLSINWEV